MTNGYQPDWDIDREFGEEGENTVRKLLGLADGAIEVKRKRRIDDYFYIETAHSPGATGIYKPSGINITKADYWAYVAGDIIFVFPVPLLKDAAREAQRVEEADGDCPTRGRLVSLIEVLAQSESGRLAAA